MGLCEYMQGGFFMEKFQVYRDIQARTGGDIYIGVVGPVRTGKSTFIRRFMELVALPEMEPAKQAEVRDQLPLSGSGKLITTVEPKFIPKEAIEVPLGDEQKVRIRLIDCVGFLVKDASGHIEEVLYPGTIKGGIHFFHLDSLFGVYRLLSGLQ